MGNSNTSQPPQKSYIKQEPQFVNQSIKLEQEPTSAAHSGENKDKKTSVTSENSLPQNPPTIHQDPSTLPPDSEIELIRRLDKIINKSSNPFLADYTVKKAAWQELRKMITDQSTKEDDFETKLEKWKAMRGNYCQNGSKISMTNEELIGKHRNIFFSEDRSEKTDGAKFLDEISTSSVYKSFRYYDSTS